MPDLPGNRVDSKTKSNRDRDNRQAGDYYLRGREAREPRAAAADNFYWIDHFTRFAR